MTNKLIGLVGALLALVAAPVRAGSPVPGFDDTSYAPGLSAPTAVAFLPDGRMLIAEKGGFSGAQNAALKVFDGVSVTTLGTIPVCTDVEMGLLGVAVDPSFASNGFIYLYRSAAGVGGCGTSTGRFNQVVRVTMSGSSIGSLTVLLDGIRTDGGNHDGGTLRIGADGLLYVSAGDTGVGDQVAPGDSTNPYAQDLSSLNGKLLRLNLDGTIPAGNPFVSTPGARGEIYAYGFRNPFRMSFDSSTGKLWVADVGDLTIEEVDIAVSGGNFGWPHCEGKLPNGCENPGDVDPLFTYSHNGGSSLGTCIIGGSFAGAAFSGFSGDYVFGDCTSSNVYHVTLNGTRDGFVGTPTLLSSGAGTPADFVTGPDGAVYYAAVSGGEIRRLAVSAGSAEQPLYARKLAIHDNADATRNKFDVASTTGLLSLGGAADDPTVVGGSLRVRGSSFDVTYPLPAANWTVTGKPGQKKSYKYKDGTLAAGPVSKALVRQNTNVKASGRGPGLTQPLASDPSPVDVVLTTGTREYCMQSGGTIRFVPDKVFVALGAPPPASCP